MEIVPKKKLRVSSAQFTKLYSSKHQADIFQLLNQDRKTTKSFCDVNVVNKSHDLSAHKCILHTSGCFKSLSALEYIISNFLLFDKDVSDALFTVIEAIYGSKTFICDNRQIQLNLSKLESHLNFQVIGKYLSTNVNSLGEDFDKFDGILKSLNKDRQYSGNDVMHDAIINCGSQQFFVHKCIVGSASDFFKTLFTSDIGCVDQNRFKIETADAYQVKQILDYIYSSEITLTEDNIYDVVCCSDYFMLSRLKHFCSDFSCTCINNDNFYKIFCYAETFRLNIVTEKVAEYFHLHLWKIAEENLFRSFSIDSVLKLLHIKCSHRCEEAVFFAALQWLKQNINERQNFISVLNRTVNKKRFSLSFLKDMLPSSFCSDSTSSLMMKNLEEQIAAEKTQNIYFVNYSCSNKFFSDVTVVAKYDLLQNQVYHVGSCDLPDYDEDTADYEVSEAATTCVFLDTYFYIIGILGKKVFKFCFTINRFVWEEVASLLEFRSGSAAAVFSCKIYVSGGLDLNQEPINSCECFDPESNLWHLVTPMVTGRGLHDMVASNQCLYVVGGVAAHEYDKSVDCFNIQTEDWQYITSNDDFPDDGKVTAVSFKHDILVINNYNDKAYSSSVVSKYNIATEAWSNVEMPCNVKIVHSLIPGDALYAIVEDNKKQLCLYDYKPSTTMWNLISVFATTSSSMN